MTKTLLWLSLLLPSLAFASGEIRLAEVGIEGYWSTSAPTAVTVEVHNPTLEAQQFVVTYEIKTPLYKNQFRTDYISQPLQLGPGEKRMHSTPVLLGGYSPQLTVKLQDGKGQLLGEDQQQLNKSTGYLVVLLCQEASRCDSAQKGLQSAGSIRDQADKQQRLTFVRLTRPFDKWWKYLVSPTVVLAETLSLKAEQRQALEEYVRQGGTLIDVSGLKVVLDSYISSEIPQSVSKGTLYRTADLNNPQLNSYLNGSAVGYYFRFYGGELAYFRSHLGTSFHFPRLRWLLAWFAAYILVVGPLNFFILRKLKRLEFGWVSIPLVAVVFAIALYWWGARDRPRQFGVDEIAVYWLDDRSPVAGVDLGVRVFSPERTEVAVSVPTEAIFISGGSDVRESFGMEGIFFGRAKSPVEGQRLWLGPPKQLQLEMARWSFSDLEYNDVRALPGTVRFEKRGTLTNATGKTFREAVYVDAHGTVFELGALGAGSVALPSDGGIPMAEMSARRDRGEKFSSSVLLQYLMSPPQRTGLKQSQEAFLGLSEEPVLNAELKDIFFTRKNYAITIVRFGVSHE